MSTAPKEVTDIALRTGGGELAQAALSIQDLIAQKHVISQCMKELMKNDEHYGLIPGAKKPSLWKPGADLIGFMFRLEADYRDEEVIHEPGYIYYRVKCVLTHIPTGKRVGSGVGSCNSRETKYVRPAAKKCPNCGGEYIIDGNPEYERDAAYKGGTLCYKKKGGCGAKFKPGDPAIDGQSNGIADPSDLDNTICKMAHKRARIDAILTATAASDFFTQDMEDLATKVVEYTPPAPKEDARPKAHASNAAPPTTSSTVSAATATSSAGPKGSGGTSTTSRATNTTPPANAVGGPAAGDTPRTAPATRKTTAADIAHEGVPRTREQNKLIQVLRGQCGGVYSGDETREQWVRIIRVYRNQAGERISTSADLSKNQATHLIDRMNKYLAQVTARAEELPDLDALGGHPPDELAKLRAEIESKQSDGDETLEMDLLDVFRVGRISDLPTQLVDKALALTMAWKTSGYSILRERVVAILGQ